MKDFPTTHWSVVLNAAAVGAPKSAEALAVLCRIYWHPVYALARSLGDAHEDAQDFAQGFFAQFVKSNLPSKAHPEMGRFRTFLLVSFRNFRSAQLRQERAAKRGGGLAFVRLGDHALRLSNIAHSSDGMGLEKGFDREWALAVLNRTEALLEQELAEEEQQISFERLSRFLPGHDDPVAYKRLSQESGKTVAALKMEVSRLRKRYLRLLRSVVSETVADPKDVTDELRYLLEVLSQ